MRCFFACALPEDAAVALVQAFEPLRLQFQGQGCRWTLPENLHCTLRFLGDTDRGRLSRVTDLASSVFYGVDAPQLEFGETGLFPPRGSRGLVLWAGLRGQVEALARLAQELERCSREVGFTPERRSFRAHVTLARLEARRAEALQHCLLPVPPAADCTPAAVNLYQSVLSPEGARYTVLQSWPLRSSSAPTSFPGTHPFPGR